MRVQSFKKNEEGRDFVVGDIHGCFDALRDAMASHDFDESKDRLFSVGDLVDRGSQSEESIDWIAKPWFHAVRGNHEQMAIGVADGKHDHDNYLRNGGGWFIAMSKDRQRLFADSFDTLPYAIDVEVSGGKVGIVHAEVNGNDWDMFMLGLRTAESNNKRRGLAEVALWARTRASYKDATPIDGVLAVFVGHTPMADVVLLGNVIYIDTGAVFGGKLTMVQFHPEPFHDA